MATVSVSRIPRTRTLDFIKAILSDAGSQADKKLSKSTGYKDMSLFQPTESTCCSSRRLFLRPEGQFTSAMQQSADLSSCGQYAPLDNHS
jgi:hypothetical protein